MRALRSLLALVVLSLWLSPAAGAFCVSEIAYDYVMREDFPAPEQSLPCCAPSIGPFAAADKDRPIEGRAPSVARGNALPFVHPAPAPVGASPSPLRWRPYCERSSRLLR
jgi:hypothetical protein